MKNNSETKKTSKEAMDWTDFDKLTPNQKIALQAFKNVKEKANQNQAPKKK